MENFILFKRHFQVAYAARNAQAAVHHFSEKYGIENWEMLDMVALHGPSAPVRFIANARVGDMMIEVIEPDEAIPSLYQNWLAADAGNDAIRLHHLGFIVEGEQAFLGAQDRLRAAGFECATDGSFGEVLDFAYFDTTAHLGHYYELIRPKSDGQSFFDRIPRN